MNTSATRKITFAAFAALFALVGSLLLIFSSAAPGDRLSDPSIDLSGNGRVDAADVSILLSNWQQEGDRSAGDPRAQHGDRGAEYGRHDRPRDRTRPPLDQPARVHQPGDPAADTRRDATPRRPPR